MTDTTPRDTARRSARVTIGGSEYELVLTTKATRLIAERYGGLDNLGPRWRPPRTSATH